MNRTGIPALDGRKPVGVGWWVSKLSETTHCNRVVTMGVPKRNALKPKQLQACPKCSTPKPSHVICPNCGHYGGRTIVETE
jgi:ribosomal protein L32